MPDLETNATPPARVGRKTRYSAALIKRLLGYISDGLNIKQSCAACGIGVSTFREWRIDYPDLEERLEAAREQMRAKILARIKEIGLKDNCYKALAEHLRLSFPELRFGNGPSVNVAVQQNMAVTDPERARLIAQLAEQRERALANTSCVEAPLQLTDASDSREEALAAKRQVKEERAIEVRVEPVREQPPKTVIERADLIEERRQWRAAAQRDEVEELLGD